MKKRTVPDRELDAYCFRWACDITVATRHRLLRLALHDAGRVLSPEKLADLLRGRGVVTTPDTIRADLEFFARCHIEEKLQAGILDVDDLADEPSPIPE